MAERQVPHLFLNPSLPAELLDPLYTPVAEASSGCPLFWLHLTSSLFTGISLISERGQGCMILRHNLATDTLGLCSPLPAHKFHFLKGTVKRGEAEMSPAGTTGPSTQVLPFTIHFLVLLLLLFSVPIPHAPSSLPPLAAGNGDTLCGHHMVQSSPHMSFCPGDTHWAVFIQKKQTSFLVAL